MRSTIFVALGGFAAVALSACAGVDRTRPSDMTVPEHEKAAREDAKEADEAASRASHIGKGAEYQRYLVKRHRDLAKAHAAAAEARRREVASACTGVGTPTPLASMRVARVERIVEADIPPARRNPRGYYPERLRGARIAVTAPEGVPAESTARALECEASRASAGLESENAADPLGVATAKATIVPGDSGVVVEIRSADSGHAEEIWHRAEALAHAREGR